MFDVELGDYAKLMQMTRAEQLMSQVDLDPIESQGDAEVSTSLMPLKNALRQNTNQTDQLDQLLASKQATL